MSLKTQKDLLGKMNGHSQMVFSRSFYFLIYKMGLTERPLRLKEHHHRGGLVGTTLCADLHCHLACLVPHPAHDTRGQEV